MDANPNVIPNNQGFPNTDKAELTRLNNDLNIYAKKLDYTLSSSNIKIWEFDIEKQEFRFMPSLGEVKERVKFDKFIERMDKTEYDRDKALYDKMKKGELEEFCVQSKVHTSIYGKGTRHFIYNGVPMKNEQDKVISYFGITRDVTDWVNVQQQLEKQIKIAQEADRLKSAFLANMSHEIRTPLNAIIGFSQLLQTTEDMQEKEQFCEIINKNNENLLRLINDILELSKIEAGVVEMQYKDVDFSDDFNNLTQTLEQHCTSQDVAFIICNPYKKCEVKCDNIRIDQMLTNFVNNAIKYTSKGHIRIAYEYKDGGLYLSVEDTGTGIPKEKQTTIFDRFVKLNDFVQGSGLGLCICKGIADACGGKIGVESELGVGSTFWTWIPCESILIEA
jgi:K+-sensing histidine kinase KdpD